ncbi:hypothetical protein STENM327S_06290 [Streptomyces tendae]
MREWYRAPTACEAMDIAGIGENPATRSGPYSCDGVHLGGGGDLEGLVPVEPDETAVPRGRLVTPPHLGVTGQLGPGGHRIAAVPALRLPVHFHQDAAGQRIANASGRIGVPGKGRAARTAAGLVSGRSGPTLG